jgi:hypothetical protein
MSEDCPGLLICTGDKKIMVELKKSPEYLIDGSFSLKLPQDLFAKVPELGYCRNAKKAYDVLAKTRVRKGYRAPTQVQTIRLGHDDL